MSDIERDDDAVIRLPATDTRAKMYAALSELQRERDQARLEAEFAHQQHAGTVAENKRLRNALEKIARHNAKAYWDQGKLCSVDQDGEPWVHWAEIARNALTHQS